MSLRNDTDFFISVVLRPDHLYEYSGGRQRHLLARFRGLDPRKEDAWRQTTPREGKIRMQSCQTNYVENGLVMIENEGCLQALLCWTDVGMHRIL